MIKGKRKPPEEMRSRYYLTRQNGKVVALHKVIAEKMLGRPLLTSESVHHINGNRFDNRPENLRIMSEGDHRRLHNMGNKFRLGIPHTEAMRRHLKKTSTAARKKKFWSSRKKQ